MEKLGTASFEIDEERVAWEGLASSCAAPIRRFAAFTLVGFTSFIAITAAVIVFYNLFGHSLTEQVCRTEALLCADALGVASPSEGI